MRNIFVISLIAMVVIIYGGNNIRDKLDAKMRMMAEQRSVQLDRLEALQMGRQDPLYNAPQTKATGSTLESFHVKKGIL